VRRYDDPKKEGHRTMANRIQVGVSNTIVTLYQQGWRKLRIAQALDVDVKTVRRHIRVAGNSLVVPAGTEAAGRSTSLVVPPGAGGRASQCAPHRADIERALDEGLSAQRIYQDLVTAGGFAGSYDAVKRFVRRLRGQAPERFQRFECAPGEEAQVDFGRGAPLMDADGRRQKTWVFRIVLSHSRKAYGEAVLRQTTEHFIRSLENAFRYWGGVPQQLVIDNLRAAVSRADWYEPELNPKVAEFCRHYGMVILPARPRHPRDKGKVESSVKYVKNNALKGRVFGSLAEQNRHLLDWEQQVADRRIHGTTRQQVARRFEQERPRLGPLPPTLFPGFQEARRCVHRDGFVEVGRAYYEVPEEYLRREVWVRWDGRTVRVFNDRWQQIAVHAQAERGRFCRLNPLATGRRAECSETWLRNEALRLGPHCGAWAEAVLRQRGVEGIRPLLGLLALGRRHAAATLERACAQALAGGAYRLRDVKLRLHQPETETTPSFLEAHPLIREMAEYGALLHPWCPSPEPVNHPEVLAHE
jgi:transposase